VPVLLALTTLIPYREHATTLAAAATIPQQAFPLAFTLAPALSSSPTLLEVTRLPVHTIDNVQKEIANVRQSTCHTARFRFTHDEVRSNLTADGVPQLYFDQLNHTRRHLDDIRSPKAHTLTRRLTGRNGQQANTSNSTSSLNRVCLLALSSLLPMPPSTDPLYFTQLWTMLTRSLSQATVY
jgi:hypothetical protein